MIKRGSKEFTSQGSVNTQPRRGEINKSLPKQQQTRLPPISSPTQKFCNSTSQNRKLVPAKQVETAPEPQRPQQSQEPVRPLSEQNQKGFISPAVKRSLTKKNFRMRSMGPNQQQKIQEDPPSSQKKQGYVQRLKDRVSIDLYTRSAEDLDSKFQNPVLTMAKKHLNFLQEQPIEEEDSMIKDEINVTQISSKSIKDKKNRLAEMKQASSHSSSNSGKNQQFIHSGSDGKQTVFSYEGKQTVFSYEESSKSKSLSLQFDEDSKSPGKDRDLMDWDIFQKEWNKKNWKQGEFLGSGSFSQVFQAIDCDTGKTFALKKIDITKNFDNEKDLEMLQREIILMRRMKHKHIITYLGHEQTDKYIYIYLEFMEKGSLSSIIRQTGPLNEQQIRNYARQVLDGLCFLHKHRVVHGDIKGANVLVDANGNVKIGDFGCSSQLGKTMSLARSNDNNLIGSLKGSIPWMPPELITQTSCGISADIWSFGCTVLEMASGKIPWSEHDFDNPVAAICKIGLEDEIPLVPTNLSADLQHFIKECLQRDPSKRPTAEQLSQHRFLNY